NTKVRRPDEFLHLPQSPLLRRREMQLVTDAKKDPDECSAVRGVQADVQDQSDADVTPPDGSGRRSICRIRTVPPAASAACSFSPAGAFPWNRLLPMGSLSFPERLPIVCTAGGEITRQPPARLPAIGPARAATRSNRGGPSAKRPEARRRAGEQAARPSGRRRPARDRTRRPPAGSGRAAPRTD